MVKNKLHLPGEHRAKSISGTCFLRVKTMVCVIKLEARKCPRGTSLEPARTKPFSNTVRAGALEGLCVSGLAQNRLWSHPSLGAHLGCRVRSSRHEQSPSRAPARNGLCASGLERSPSRAPAPIVYEMGFARAGSHGSHSIAYRPQNQRHAGDVEFVRAGASKVPLGRLRAWCLNWTVCERARAKSLSGTCARRA